MSKRKRVITVAGSGALAAVVAIAIQLGSSTSASGSPTSTQTIDAKTDPTAAAQALNTCAVQGTTCTFTKSGDIQVAMGPARILGDALYNCGGAEAEDTVALSDERSESTSVEQSLSVKASVEVFEVAKASFEAEVTSKHLDEAKTKTTQTNSVSVEPGEIGWTETQVPTATLTGTYSITNGGNQINVINVQLTYPGIGKSDDPSLNQISWTSQHAKMSATDVKERCSVLPPLNPTKASSSAPGAVGPSSNVSVVLCLNGGGPAHCRTITGIGQSIPKGTSVSLVRGAVVYATGKAGNVLRATRPVAPGHYTLLLSGPHTSSMLGVKVS